MHGAALAASGFQGLKITQDVYAAQRPGVHRIGLLRGCDRLLTWPPGTIGAGGNSGFQALNLALQFGARHIVLVGFDLHDRAGTHWHRDHDKRLTNPQATNLARWRRALDAQAAALEAIGAEVVVVGAGSALSAYRKVETLAAAIAALTGE